MSSLLSVWIFHMAVKKTNYTHMKENIEEEVWYRDEDYKQISLLSFIAGFFVFIFKRFVKP